MPPACQCGAPTPGESGHDGLVANPTSDELAAVLRWRASGGEVRVLAWGPPVVVALITCDGGQEMQRITSDAADLRAELGG